MAILDGYVRVSRVAGREGDSFISPDVQRQTIERLAAAKGVELGEVVQELDVSGGAPIERRELGRLVRKVESGESAGIIVWKASRFSRDQLDCITVARRITDAGGVLLGDDLDTSAPTGARSARSVAAIACFFAPLPARSSPATWRAGRLDCPDTEP